VLEEKHQNQLSPMYVVTKWLVGTGLIGRSELALVDKVQSRAY